MTRLAVLVVVALAVLVTPAIAAPDWDGTWAGNWANSANGGVQIILAGNDIIGIYWRGDYLSDEIHSTASTDGKVLTFTWKDGGATLIRDSETTAHFEIHAGQDKSSGVLKRDRS